jgi:hypothetical protein
MIVVRPITYKGRIYSKLTSSFYLFIQAPPIQPFRDPLQNVVLQLVSNVDVNAFDLSVPTRIENWSTQFCPQKLDYSRIQGVLTQLSSHSRLLIPTERNVHLGRLCTIDLHRS